MHAVSSRALILVRLLARAQADWTDRIRQVSGLEVRSQSDL